MDNLNPANVPPVSGIKCATSPSSYTDLRIGDPAPPLSIAKWLKGEPLNELARGKISVVELWASWCDPCRLTMPHLSELQNQYPDVDFLSVAIWEDDENDPQEFIDQAENVTHRVATDRPSNDPSRLVGDDTLQNIGQMACDWMQASGESGVPTAFLIDREGCIAWIGHPDELDEVLPALIDGTLVVDTKSRDRDLTLHRLRVDPTAKIDASIFTDLFNRKAPSIADANLDWLKLKIPSQLPPLTPASEPAEKSGGLMSRIMGRSKEEKEREKELERKREKEKARQKEFEKLVAELKSKEHIYSGPPKPGKPYALLLLPMLCDDGFTPGWEIIDDPVLNTLPKASSGIEFVAVISGDTPFEELYDDNYHHELVNWSITSNWRLGFEVAPDEDSEENAEEDSDEDSNEFKSDFPFTDKWLYAFSQRRPPVAAFVSDSGEILWFGSPLKLPEAVEAWSRGELTPERAADDLVFWNRLQASAEANERLAGVHESSHFEGVIGDGPKFENDPKLVEIWEETVENLKKQLPWRAGRWRIFEFRIAAAKARQARHAADLTAKLVEQFRTLTNDLEECVGSSQDYMMNWKSLIKEALDYMGLMDDPMQPLDTAGLLVVEGHPLTLAILDSVARHDAAIPEPELQLLFEPRLSPLVLFKLDRIEEAVAEQERMIQSFDKFAESSREVMESIQPQKEPDQDQDEEANADEDANEDESAEMKVEVDDMTERMLEMMLGEPSSAYRSNLVALRDHYKKYLDRS